MIRTRKLVTILFSLVLAVNVQAYPANTPGFSDQGEFDDVTTIEDEADLLVSDLPKIEGEDQEIYNRELRYGKDFFQGDIKLNDEQKNAILSNSTVDLDTRTGLLSEDFRWPKNANRNPVIPYTIAANSGFTTTQLNIIRQGMRDIEKFTCIRFVSRTNEKDYVKIISGDGCYSQLGKVGSMQELSLQKNGCIYRGTIIHELIHAIGYDHMHNHADRDKYVDIKWPNIETDNRDQFDKVNARYFGNFGTRYDLLSIMHYDSTAFGVDGKNTIVPKDRAYLNKIGKGSSMSRGDALRINNMYKCKV